MLDKTFVQSGPVIGFKPDYQNWMVALMSLSSILDELLTSLSTVVNFLSVSTGRSARLTAC